MSFDIAVQARIGDFACDFAFATGPGLTAVLGASGAGKTSLLLMAAGVVRPDRGRLAIGGRTYFDSEQRIDVAVERRHCGLIFQDGRLFPHLSVRDNLLYGAKLSRGRAAIMDVDRATDFLGIAALLDRRPATLSGGEAQRVAIGRALLAAPDYLLMDEPLSGLDRPRRDEVMTVIERLRDELALPILLVSHQQDEVARLADHLVLIDRGRVEAAGPTNAVLTDIGHLPAGGDAGSVLQVEPVGHDPRYDITAARIGKLTLQIPGDWTASPRPLRLRIRASDVSLSVGAGAPSTILNSLPARIVGAEASGAHMMAALLLEGGADARILASVTRKSWEQLDLAIGMEVTAHIKAMALVDR